MINGRCDTHFCLSSSAAEKNKTIETSLYKSLQNIELGLIVLTNNMRLRQVICFKVYYL